MIARRRGWPTIISALWIIFAITNMLVFPTIWSAATGYLIPSSRNYLMPDPSLVPLNSEHLAMCWVLVGGSRLGLEDGYIEMGPTLDVVYAKRERLAGYGISLSRSTEMVWDQQFIES
jgi:hypothetical protein